MKLRIFIAYAMALTACTSEDPVIAVIAVAEAFEDETTIKLPEPARSDRTPVIIDIADDGFLIFDERQYVRGDWNELIATLPDVDTHIIVLSASKTQASGNVIDATQALEAAGYSTIVRLAE